MKTATRSIWLTILILFCGFLGFWLVRSAAPAVAVESAPVRPPVTRRVEPERLKASKVEDRQEFDDGITTVQAFSSCHPNELILRFPSVDTFNSFTAAISTSRVTLVAQLGRLLAMRVSYSNEQDMRDLLTSEHVTFFQSVAPPPDRGAPTLTSESGGEPVGNGVLKMLGITGDRSRWGEGVRIGILDSGVIAHPTLKHFTRSIEVVPFPRDLTQTNGHGTAIASLAAGSLPDAQGIAPAAEIISIKVATEEGRSDALYMATGILAAVDERVDILNISMGQSSDNPLLSDAVAIAQQSGMVIVASAGNDGVSDAGYPADYPDVISVGAVDGKGIHMGFSNFGKKLSLTAPGYGVNAAWPVGRYVSISGTSASTPIVSGAIAVTMSNGTGPRLTAKDAAAAVIACADDTGIPGPDTEYGMGMLDVGRVMRRNTPGILDAAITDLRMVQTPGNPSAYQIEISVQNQGTAMISNPLVEIRTPSGVQQAAGSAIMPGDHSVFTLPVYPANWPGKRYEISAVVQYANAAHDITPANNLRKGTFSPQ